MSIWEILPKRQILHVWNDSQGLSEWWQIYPKFSLTKGLFVWRTFLPFPTKQKTRKPNNHHHVTLLHRTSSSFLSDRPSPLPPLESPLKSGPTFETRGPRTFLSAVVHSSSPTVLPSFRLSLGKFYNVSRSGRKSFFPFLWKVGEGGTVPRERGSSVVGLTVHWRVTDSECAEGRRGRSTGSEDVVSETNGELPWSMSFPEV